MNSEENKKTRWRDLGNWPQRTLLTVAAFTGLLVIVALLNGSGEGIYDTSSRKAVYISGNSCIINTEINRSEEVLKKDFEECLEYHKAFQAHELR